MRARGAPYVLVMFLAAALVGGSSTALSAQTDESPTLTFGPAGGGGGAWLTASAENADLRAAPGWSAGVFADYRLSERLVLHPEVLYTERGVYEDLSLIDENLTLVRWYRTQYVQIPLLARYGVPVGPDWLRPHATGGIAPAVRLRATNTVNGQVENLDDQVRAWDAALVLGVGTHVETPVGRFWVDARYDFGIIDIDSTRLRGANRNQAATVMGGYVLPWGW